MRYISLFSGIEAASVAWRDLGWEPVAFSEIDAFPSAVLAYRFPDVPNLGDITKIDWKEVTEKYGAVDIVVGGSPCQSFSIAGGRDSLDGESRLMYEYIRAVREIRPRWLLWENVPGVLSVRDNAFGQLLGELSDSGYSLAWRVLDAQFFGVAQRRRRVFLVGCLGEGGAPAAALFEPESVSGNTQSSREKRQELARAVEERARSGGFKFNQGAGAGGVGYEIEQSPTLTADYHNPVCLTPWDVQSKRIFDPSGVAPTLNSGDHEGGNILVDRQSVVCIESGQANAAICEDYAPTLNCTHEHPALVQGGYIVRRLTPMECERLQGFPDGWTDVPYRGKEHAPDTPRYKACGNSMAVPVMRWIGERIQIVDELVKANEIYANPNR